MAMHSKRKCYFNDALQKDYPFLKSAGKGSSVFCTICNSVFSISSGGRTSIKDHEATSKHKASLTARAGSTSVTSFFRKVEPSQSEFDLALQEGVFSYHTIAHNHSFRSMDCTSGLNRKFFNPKFCCARTKCDAIVTNVLAPWSTDELKHDLEHVNFVALSIDASNHGHVKLLPIMVRYFKVQEESTSVETKLLDFVELKGETAELISEEVIKIIQKFHLENKVVAISADNTNTNFGGLRRQGRENVHTKVRRALQREVLGLGCPAHIVHNCARTALDTIPVDVEYILNKIFGYFHIFTVRVERLKSFCEFVGQEYQNILGHSNVRWLSMLPALERILMLYEPLKSFFLSEEKCPVVLRKTFEDPTTELWLTFIHSTMSLFHDTIKSLEGQDRCAVESAEILNTLKTKLSARHEEDFVPVMVKKQIKELERAGVITQASYFKVARTFFDASVQYLHAWGKHIDDLKDLQCLLLKRVPARSDIEKTVELLNIKCPNVTIDEDALFDEVTFLNAFLKEKIPEWNTSAPAVSVASKWNAVMNHFTRVEVPHVNLQKLAEVVLCLPGSNAPVERVFSLMNDVWTAEKSRFLVETIKAILIVKTNFKLSCLEFVEKISKNKNILRQIHSSEKYAS